MLTDWPQKQSQLQYHIETILKKYSSMVFSVELQEWSDFLSPDLRGQPKYRGQHGDLDRSLPSLGSHPPHRWEIDFPKWHSVSCLQCHHSPSTSRFWDVCSPSPSFDNAMNFPPPWLSKDIALPSSQTSSYLHILVLMTSWALYFLTLLQGLPH